MWLYSVIFGMFTIFSSQLLTASAMLKETTDQYAVSRLYTGFHLIRTSVELLRENEDPCLPVDTRVITAACLDKGIAEPGYTLAENTLYTENNRLEKIMAYQVGNGKAVIVFLSDAWALHNLASKFEMVHQYGTYGFKQGNNLFSAENQSVELDILSWNALQALDIKNGAFVYIF